MQKKSTTDLKSTLQLGLTVVTEKWCYRAKDWVTGVHVADIDDDGDDEIIAVSRDGRVCVLTREGDVRWNTLVTKPRAWIETVIGIASPPVLSEQSLSSELARIMIGTHSGEVYGLNKDGQIVSPSSKASATSKEDQSIDKENKLISDWFHCAYPVRQIYAKSEHADIVLIGAEDRYAYALSYTTGDELWRFATGGGVNAVYAYDIDSDGEMEGLIGSSDHFLYLLNKDGKCINRKDMNYAILTIFVADIDKDGFAEILISTEEKKLFALNADLTLKWSFDGCTNRLLSLQAIDIDNDGYYEILVGSEDKHIYIIDHKGKPVWRYNLGARVFSLYTSGIDKEGSIELYVGAEDSKVHALKVSLNKELSRKIYKVYGRPAPSTIEKLSISERTLLHDILPQGKVQSKSLTFKQIEDRLKQKKEYRLALADLVALDLQRVQVLWAKPVPDYVRTLCTGNISGDINKEIIVGTAKGSIVIFGAGGRQLWSLPITQNVPSQQEQVATTDSIIAVETTRMNSKEKLVNVLVCSTDHHLYVIKGVNEENAKKSKRSDPKIINIVYVSDWMSSFSVRAIDTQGFEIIIGSEDKKVFVYNHDLKRQINIASVEHSIKIVHATMKKEKGEPDIIAASFGNWIYAYCLSEDSSLQLQWSYETYGRVHALCSSINNKGNIEIIVGSEDRNVHVLDHTGKLKWRYYLPHSVLSVAVGDVNADENKEIVVGCADGNLYIFDTRGDLLWTYDAGDRIQDICITDVNNDGAIEIVLGIEDRVELLQFVSQADIYTKMDHYWSVLQEGRSAVELIREFMSSPDSTIWLRILGLNVFAEIAYCWTALQQKRSREDLIQEDGVLRGKDAWLRTLALDLLAEQGSLIFDNYFEIFEALLKDNSIEVRRALIRTIVNLYPYRPEKVQSLLAVASKDNDLQVRLAFINCMDVLMKSNWPLGFDYLKRFSGNTDRFVRRAVILKVQQLINGDHIQRSLSKKIFVLLLGSARDGESEWIRQEAARGLAFLLSNSQRELVFQLFKFIVLGIEPKILMYIASHCEKILVKRAIDALVCIMTDVSDGNSLERIRQIMDVLKEMQELSYGEDVLRVYSEFYRLFTIRSIYEIADYRCQQISEPSMHDNQYYIAIIGIFNRLNTITRPLRSYRGLYDMNDRLNSLLLASQAIDTIYDFIKEQYFRHFSVPIPSQLPDRILFGLLLDRWRAIIGAHLKELGSGSVKLELELVTRNTHHEELVGFCLIVRNTGRSKANGVEITLLRSKDFDVPGKNMSEIECILPGIEVPIEFVIRPHTGVASIMLNFEVFCDEVTDAMLFSELLQFQHSSRSSFRTIPNPYSTGLPSADDIVFYGRDEDIKYLCSNLTRTEARTMIVLYGQRRLGKTSLLLRLKDSEHLGDHIAVFIDMQGIVLQTDRFFYTIAKHIFDAMKARLLLIPEPQLSDFTVDINSAFEAVLDNAARQLSQQKIIIMLDEFDSLAGYVDKGEFDPKLFEYLRYIMQHRQYMSFLLAGTHKINMLTGEYWSVFFNTALKRRLSQLSPVEAEALIRNPVEGYLEYEPHVVTKLRHQAGDQPYLIHLLCRTLIDYCNEKQKNYATLNDVNIVSRDIMLTVSSYYESIWSLQLGQHERIALSVLASEGKDERRAFSLLELEDLYKVHRIPFKRGQLTISLKALVEANVIERVQDEGYEGTVERSRYRVALGLLRSWLVLEQPLQQVLYEERS